MLSGVLAILGIGLIMFVHEMGHTLAAKAGGIEVAEFSLGFGPKIVSFVWGKTRYSIRAIPLWAYAAMEERTDPPGRGYLEQNVFRRMCVAIGGPATSILFAAVLFGVIFSIVGGARATTVIDELLPGYPAELAGFQKGDRIVAIEGRSTPAWEDVVEVFRASPGKPLRVTVSRQGTETTIGVVPALGENGIGVVGIRPTVEVRREGLARAMRDGFRQTFLVAIAWVEGLSAAITRKVPLEIVGPVGIGQMIAQASRSGLSEALFIIGVFSAIVGMGNLLPIPMLDGGRLVFLLVEAVRGKPVDQDKENFVHAVGFAITLALGLLITFKDIQRLIT